MTNDLIERLRSVDVSWSETGEWCAEAADRIKQLETALRIIVRETTAVSPDVLNQQMCIDAVNRHAIAALEGKSNDRDTHELLRGL